MWEVMRREIISRRFEDRSLLRWRVWGLLSIVWGVSGSGVETQENATSRRPISRYASLNTIECFRILSSVLTTRSLNISTEFEFESVLRTRDSAISSLHGVKFSSNTRNSISVRYFI